jgi:hypothetical protein
MQNSWLDALRGAFGGGGGPLSREKEKARPVHDDSLEESLSEARALEGKIGRAQDIWPAVELWYERAKNGERVMARVVWSPAIGEDDEEFSAYGVLSAFTDEQTGSRGLEGDLRDEDVYWRTPRHDVPIHLRIEKRGDEKATPEVTNGWGYPEKQRLLDYAYLPGHAQRTFLQKDDATHWTMVQLGGSEEELGITGKPFGQ